MEYKSQKKQYLSAKEVGQILNVSESTVIRLAKKKAIPYIKVSNMYRFHADKFEEWLNKDIADENKN